MSFLAHHCLARYLRFMVLALICALGGVGATRADPRDWTLANGVTIRAEFIAKIGNRHWLRESSAGLHKLHLTEVSAADAEFIRATLAGPSARSDGTGFVLVLERPEGRVEEMLETLARTSVPSVHFQGTPMRASLAELSALVAEVAPERGRIEFRIHPECHDTKFHMSLHNMSAWLVLQLMADNAQVRLAFHADHIEILPRAPTGPSDFIPSSS